MFCTQCGNKMAEDGVFCTQCGTKAGEENNGNNVRKISVPSQSGNAGKADAFLMIYSKFFPENKLQYIHAKLSDLSDERFVNLHHLKLRNPTNVWLCSFFLGPFTARFLLGNQARGFILLVLFLSVFGWIIYLPWALIDLFIIRRDTREYNFDKLRSLLALV